MSKSLKKALTVAVSAMTALWSVGVAAFAPLAAAAAPSAAAVSEGDLIKASLPAVYYVGANGKRYVFPNEKTYKTWYANFSGVETITDAELAAVAIGGNVTYRPGSRLAKITTDPKVYMIGSDAELHAIADENTALDLFGSTWSQKVDDIPDAFFTNYTVSSESVATGLGLGALPVGTLVSFDGEYYVVGAEQNYWVSGDVSMYGAVVTPGNSSEFAAWMGEDAADITDEVDAADLLGLFTPDRQGVEEGGSGVGPTPTSGVSVTGTRTATNLSMASGSSQNLGRAEIKICSGNSPVTVSELRTSFAAGTVSANTTMSWFDFGNVVYEQSGTESNDTIALYESNDVDVTINGCQTVHFYASTNATSGVLHVRMKSVTVSGAAAAALVESSFVLQNRQVAAVASSDLMDWSITSPVSPASVQAEGSTLTQLYSAQVAISNNDAYVPNAVFRVNGSLVVNGCEFRIAGSTVATEFTWAGKHMVFAIPEGKRMMTQSSKSWELWCKVIGEAGQTITVSNRYPAPHFYFFDNDRVAAAALPNDVSSINKENVNQGIAILNATPGNTITVTGSSATAESINVNNMKNGGVQLTDKRTSGETNTLVGAFKVRIRGSKATLSSLTMVMSGTHNAKGMTGCQIKIGQRTDKGEINSSSVDLADYSLSNFGGENALDDTPNVTVTSTKQMAIGDWLIVVECDVITNGAAYANNDVMAITLVDANNTNLSFDQGTSQDFPAANTTGTTITIRLLSALTVASNGTVRFLVSNATNVVIGEYTITGPSQEGVNVTSIGITFEGSSGAGSNIVGTDGCTTVGLQNVSGQELATSQSLTISGAADVTLTFSVNFSVAANAEYKVRVVCVQGASAPTAGTVTAATTLATISGTGQASSQSFSNTPATAGANVVKAATGTVTTSVGQLQPTEIIGPSQQQKLGTFQTSASIHENMDLDTLAITVTAGSAALATDLSTIVVRVENFSIQGAMAAAETTVCTRTITGASPATVTCTFGSNAVTLGAGQTGIITIYGTGNTLGSIGNDASPTDGTLTPSITIMNDNTSQIVYKGSESQTLVFNTAATGAVNGRVVTPAGAQVRVVNKALPSTTLPGQANMLLGLMDLIISGTSITLSEVSGTCTSNEAATCAAGVDTIALELDDTTVAGGGTLAIAGGVFDGSGITATLITPGTHKLELLLTDTGNSCSTGDTVQLATSEFGFTVNGVPGVTQSFASAGAGAFPVTVLPDFNTFAGSVMTHPSNLCG